jgi:hypothetical protein
MNDDQMNDDQMLASRIYGEGEASVGEGHGHVGEINVIVLSINSETARSSHDSRNYSL